MANPVVGQTVDFFVDFDIDGVPTDPTTISVEFIHDRTRATLGPYTYAAAQVTKDGTGHFERAQSFTRAGDWRWKWTGTGTVAAVDVGVITIDPTGF